MTVYVVLLEDRHMELFSDENEAIARARELAVDNSFDGKYDEKPVDGWLFYCTYSPEGDSVRVVTAELAT